MGIGSMPQSTFAISYIWENNKYSEINTNYHYALIHGCTALGPAAGMVLAGQITTIWVDQVDKERICKFSLNRLKCLTKFVT